MKLVVATSFPIHPPRGGGQVRVRSVFGALAANGIAVDLVTLGPTHSRPRVLDLGPGMRELRIPKSPAFEAAEWELTQAIGIPAEDIALGMYHELLPNYAEVIRTTSAGASAVVAPHPYPEPCLRAVRPDLPLIYEAGNVEAQLKRDMILSGSDPPDRGGADEAIEAVRAWEQACCDRAALILACSGDDAAQLNTLYGAPLERMRVVPNGASAADVQFASVTERRAAQGMLGLDHPTALFVGSWHEPNIDAAAQVLTAAAALPDVRFLVAGSVGYALEAQALSDNVHVLGVVAERHLDTLLRIVHVALNPMRIGSGTNLKMIRYAMAGTPILSTAFGARGLGFTPAEHYVCCAPEHLAERLRQLLAEPAEDTEARVLRARTQAVDTLDWEVIGRGLLADERLTALLACGGSHDG